MSKKIISPVRHLQEISKRYKTAWRIVDELRQNRDFEDWCFLPMTAYYAIICKEHGLTELPISLANDISDMAALGAWRVTQGIYNFDENLSTALFDTELTSELPCDVFYHLPEWCVYIQASSLMFSSFKLDGFFVHLEKDTNTNEHELRLLLDVKLKDVMGIDKEENGLIPVPVHLGKWSLLEAVEKSVQVSLKNGLGLLGKITANANDFSKSLTLEISPLISLILYLCSKNPDFSGSYPSYPTPKKTKNGMRFFPPEKPKLIQVGKEIGDTLRTFENRVSSSTNSGSKRPHIRRGHWHGYWKGKRTNDIRQFNYNWIPPTLINAEQNKAP